MLQKRRASWHFTATELAKVIHRKSWRVLSAEVSRTTAVNHRTLEAIVVNLPSRRPIPITLSQGSFAEAFKTLGDGCQLPHKDSEVLHFMKLDKWLTDDPASYVCRIERLAQRRLHKELSADYLHILINELLAAQREAGLAAFACGAAMQICLADLALIEELDDTSLPASARDALRQELMYEAIDLVHRLIRNMVLRFRVSRPPATAGKAGSCVRLAERVTSTPIHLARHDEGQPLLIIVAAGRGTRLRSTIPKGMIPVGGIPMIERVIRAANDADIRQIVFVLRYRAIIQTEFLSQFGTVIVQSEAQGTGHSAMQAMAALPHRREAVFLAYCDTPFLDAESFRRLMGMTAKPDEVLRLSVFTPADVNSGRIIRDDAGRVMRIGQPRLGQGAESAEGDGGLYTLRHERTLQSLANLTNENPRREYQFTDVVAQLTAEGCTVGAIRGSREEFQSVNTPADLNLARLRIAESG